MPVCRGVGGGNSKSGARIITVKAAGHGRDRDPQRHTGQCINALPDHEYHRQENSLRRT